MDLVHLEQRRRIS